MHKTLRCAEAGGILGAILFSIESTKSPEYYLSQCYSIEGDRVIWDGLCPLPLEEFIKENPIDTLGEGGVCEVQFRCRAFKMEVKR